MSFHSRVPLSLFLIAAVGACGSAPEIGELELAISSGYRAQVKKGTLFVTGNAASSRLALRLGAGGTLEVDVGGDGNDTLIGGVGAETFFGGAGDDTIDGGGGSDVVFMGPGDDTFVWRPGGNSDVIEGGDGADTLVFNGSAASEAIELSANDGRLRL